MTNKMHTFIAVAENAFRDCNFVKAEFFLRRAEREGRATARDAEALSTAIENLAVAQTQLKKWPTAVASFERAMKVRKTHDILNNESHTRLCYKLADAHFHNKNYWRCEQFIKLGRTTDPSRNSNSHQLRRLILSLNFLNKDSEVRYYRQFIDLCS